MEYWQHGACVSLTQRSHANGDERPSWGGASAVTVRCGGVLVWVKWVNLELKKLRK